MGKISKVLYKEIDPKKYDVDDVGEFYFHHNLIGLSDDSTADYENYQMKQHQMKQQLIREMDENEKIKARHPTTIGISTMKNRAILLIDCG